jgi:hypothetical protein
MYLLIGPLTGFGDWSYVARKLKPELVWIVGITALGLLLLVRLPSWPERDPPDPPVRIASWAWVVAGMVSGLGFVLVLGQGLGWTCFATMQNHDALPGGRAGDAPTLRRPKHRRPSMESPGLRKQLMTDGSHAVLMAGWSLPGTLRIDRRHHGWDCSHPERVRSRGPGEGKAPGAMTQG